jgi:hypothetical protein
MAAPPFAKVRQHRVRNSQQAKHIGFIDARDLCLAGLLHSADQAVTGVVDEHVCTTETCQRRLHGRSNLKRKPNRGAF